MPRGVYARVNVDEIKGKKALERLIDQFAKAADGTVSKEATSIIFRIAARRSREGISASSNPDGRAWAPMSQSPAALARHEVSHAPLAGWDSKLQDIRRSPLGFALQIGGDKTTSGGKPISVVQQHGGKRPPRDAATGLRFGTKDGKSATGKQLAKIVFAHMVAGGTLKRDAWKLPARGILPKRRVPRRWLAEIRKALKREMPKSFFVKG